MALWTQPYQRVVSGSFLLLFTFAFALCMSTMLMMMLLPTLAAAGRGTVALPAKLASLAGSSRHIYIYIT